MDSGESVGDIVEEEPKELHLVPCVVCKRTFQVQNLKKHEKICRKYSTKKRKVFNAQRQRFEGTDIPYVPPLPQPPQLPVKKQNWRQKHEDFINTIRSAKGVTKALKEGKPLPPPPPSTINPDHIQCPYCQRRFAVSAAERHISFCKEQAARMGKSRLQGQTPTRLNPRTQHSLLNKAGMGPKTPRPLGRGGPVPGQIQSSTVGATQTPSRGRGGLSVGISGRKVLQRDRRSTPGSDASIELTSRANGVANASPVLKSRVTNITSGRSEGKVQSDACDGGGRYSNATCRIPSRQSGPKACTQCGTQHPVNWARFCCMCGARRMPVNSL
uniref:zinc finger C2HC domain-containing protein 1B-like n=1 Tax=Myxine glutinosa TaxID=7769 RepID=UPI00358DE86D